MNHNFLFLCQFIIWNKRWNHSLRFFVDTWSTYTYMIFPSIMAKCCKSYWKDALTTNWCQRFCWIYSPRSINYPTVLNWKRIWTIPKQKNKSFILQQINGRSRIRSCSRRWRCLPIISSMSVCSMACMDCIQYTRIIVRQSHWSSAHLPIHWLCHRCMRIQEYWLIIVSSEVTQREKSLSTLVLIYAYSL